VAESVQKARAAAPHNAQDCPDGDQIEEADLDVLFARVERSAVT